MRYKNLKWLVLLAFLAGCSHLQMESRPKTIGGETCLEFPKMRVLQALDEGILAYLCPMDTPSYYNDPWDNCSYGDMVFMPVARKANDYVDEQKVTLTKTQCFVGDGKYKYTTNGGVERTVRKIKILQETASVAGVKKSE